MFRLSAITVIALCCAGALLMCYVAYELAFPAAAGKKVLIDFDVFYLAATLISEGNLAGAYNAELFHERQKVMTGYSGSPLIWSYPPPFNLVVHPLILAPNWLSYLLFMGGTLAIYLWVLKTLAGAQFHTTLILCLGLFPLLLRAGQNGFLTASLIGLTCLLALRRSHWAGVPLGLMVFKPHLALAVGVWSLLDRRWIMAAAALATALLTCVIATIMYSPEIWAWFREGLTTTEALLREGRYPLFRMTSVFAFGLSAGLSAAQAMALHLGLAAAAMGILVMIQFSATASMSSKIGMAVFVSALISPYNYDYDLAMLACAFALLLPVIAERATGPEKAAIFAGMWFVGFYGLVMTFSTEAELLSAGWRNISLSGPVLVLIGVLLFRIERRAR